jgi:hypothetical protein
MRLEHGERFRLGGRLGMHQGGRRAYTLAGSARAPVHFQNGSNRADPLGAGAPDADSRTVR